MKPEGQCELIREPPPPHYLYCSRKKIRGMKDVKRDFQERLNEINLYFAFLENVILKDGKLLYPNGSSETIDATLIKTLRANGFLLIYNLAESCIKRAIEEIYIGMRRDSIEYDNIKEGIRKEIINYLRSGKTGT